MCCASPLARTLFDVYNEISGLKNRCNKTTAKWFSLLGETTGCVWNDAIFIVISSAVIKSVGSALSIRRHAEKICAFCWFVSRFCHSLLFSLRSISGLYYHNSIYLLRYIVEQHKKRHKTRESNRIIFVWCSTIDVNIFAAKRQLYDSKDLLYGA